MVVFETEDVSLSHYIYCFVCELYALRIVYSFQIVVSLRLILVCAGPLKINSSFNFDKFGIVGIVWNCCNIQ